MKKRARVGPVTFAIKLVKELASEAGESLDGHISFHDSAILLRAGMGPQRTRQTLWHELAHAVLAHAGIEHDEHMVELISNSYLMLLIDNPWLGEAIE